MGKSESGSVSSGLLGARASNAGDVFHELWALRCALGLLIPKTELKAVTVEGVAAPASAEHRYDGVDCALFYGETTLERASRVEFLQLKYSTAAPSAQWTVARLTANSAKKGNNSVLRKLATAHSEAIAVASSADIVIRLVSNQPVDPAVQEVLRAIQEGDVSAPDAVRVIDATGLSGQPLKAFLSILDLPQTSAGSRRLLMDSLTFAVSEIVNGNADTQVLVLQERVRSLMLPGAEKEKITQHAVLSWFGISSIAGLFPAPADLQVATNPIDRLPARELVRALNGDSQLICLHGQGGCGKTTTLVQLSTLLPRHSVCVIFDCYGAGRYTHTNDRRHLPENAFLQIANELAWAQETPFLIANASTNPASIRTFLEKVASAAKILGSVDQDAILAILIDAADNAVAAAELSTPPSPCFIWEITQADRGRLPSNVRIILSTRSARKSKLRLPRGTPEIDCPAFTPEETGSFARSRQSNLSDSWIEQFHALSNGIPRVQSYAFAKGAGSSEAVLDSLRPHGKKLDTVLRELFQSAAIKAGDEDFFVRCVAALATLPAPIPLNHLAEVAKCSVGFIVDFVGDVHPTLRIEEDAVTIADEDVEDFLTKESTTRLQLTLQEVCEHFSTRFRSDSYAAVHYCDFLERASRAAEILPILERDLLPAGISDPIVRREVQLRRLRLALRACQSASSPLNTLKVVLLSAEAAKDEDAFRGLLERETDLSVRYASSSLFRLVLSDRDSYPKQGSILAQDAARTALAGEFVSARERLNAYRHWMDRRKEAPRDEWDAWEVETDDIVAIVEAIAIMEGAAAAKAAVVRWRPVALWPRVGLDLIPRLIARGRGHIVEAAYRTGLLRRPWSLMLTVPLALSGAEISLEVLSQELAALRQSNVPDLHRSRGHRDDGWELTFLETIVTACEIGLARGVAHGTLLAAVQLILHRRRSPAASISETESLKIDIALRAWIIWNHLTGIKVNDDQFREWLKGGVIARKQRRRRGKKNTRAPDNERDDRLAHTVKAIFPAYVARVTFLVPPTRENAADASVSQLSKLGADSYYFDRNYWSSDFRRRAAQSIVRLMHVKNVALSDLYEHAEVIAKGDRDDSFATQLLPVWRELLLRPSIHQTIIDAITARAAELRVLRTGARSKAEALTELSRLVTNFSEADARVLFERTMEIVLEIDREAVVQIDFVASLAQPNGAYGFDVARNIAARYAAFVTDVAIRLEGEEHFPWESSTEVLAKLAPEVALAAVSQWQDEGVASLTDTLPALMSVLASRSAEDVLRSCALLVLLPRPPKTLFQTIADALGKLERPKAIAAFEMLSAHCLLHIKPGDRTEIGRVILRAVPDDIPSGACIQRLRDAVAYSGRPDDQGPPSIAKARPTIKFRPDADFSSFAGISAAISDALEQGTEESYITLRTVLQAVSERITAPAQRVPYLDALVQFGGDSLYAHDRAAAIVAALREWQDGPAVEDWRTNVLPGIITSNLWALSRWMHERSQGVVELLDATGRSARERIDIIASGLEQETASFNSATLFGLAKLMVPGLSAEESQQIADWYVARLYQGVPCDIQSRYVAEDICTSLADAVGRFLFAQMSDIDVRVRWRAAHCVRKLVALSGPSPLLAMFGAYERTQEQSFRLRTAPFYWLSARLWLVMTAARLSAEHPIATSSIAPELLAIALDEDLPHYLIRSNAKEALQTLVCAKAVSLNRREQRRLDHANRPKRKMIQQNRASHRELEGYERKKQRFHFDYLDTVRYWYAPLHRHFATLTPEKFFRTLEKWLLDRWKVDPEATWWKKEPRRSRYSDREQMSSSHSHGSQPTVERYGTYLEWHAMFCGVGEWLESESLIVPEWESDALDHYMRRWGPTEPPSWLADRRGFTPLEADFVFDERGEDKHWLRRVPKAKFLSAIDQQEDDWSQLTVYGNWTISRRNRETAISIASALVSSDTAQSLLRALQPADEYKFFLPMERQDDDRDIKRDPFVLRSWLAYVNNESQFDEKDPLRNDVGGLSVAPAKWLLKKYRLKQLGVPASAWSRSAGQAWFSHHAWADFGSSEADYRYAHRQTGASGFRLRITNRALREVLVGEKLDLVVKVQIERRLENEYGPSSSWSDKEKRRTAQRYFIFRKNGTVEDDRRHIAAWLGAGQSARARSKPRSAG